MQYEYETYLDFSPEILMILSEEQEERFYQYVKTRKQDPNFDVMWI